MEPAWHVVVRECYIVISLGLDVGSLLLGQAEGVPQFNVQWALITDACKTICNGVLDDATKMVSSHSIRFTQVYSPWCH